MEPGRFAAPGGNAEGLLGLPGNAAAVVLHNGSLPGGIALGVVSGERNLVEGALADGGGIALKGDGLQICSCEAPGTNCGNRSGHGEGGGSPRSDWIQSN